MFADRAKIYIRSGKGGDGHVSFRREKYVPNGGPDGGDGGKGGDVIVEVDEGMNMLTPYRHIRKYCAQDGENGKKRNCRGKNGEDIILKVPAGTVFKDANTGKVIADMSGDNKRIVLLNGGKGGNGNQHYATARMQAPKYAQPGQSAIELNALLELKVIADVGLLGFPNAGKSTLLSVISNAKPEIANYPFTTLAPQLGVVELEGTKGFVVADIPGLIEGASEGVGLGHDFLRHVERTKVMIHIVDVAQTDGRDALTDIDIINNELAKYDEELAKRPQIIAANKIDAIDEDNDIVAKLSEKYKAKGYEVYPISAATGKGVKELMYAVRKLLDTLPDEVKVFEPEMEVGVPDFSSEPYEVFYVEKEKAYHVEGPRIEKMLGYTNLESEKGFVFFQNFLKDNGILDELESLGIQEGDTVKLYGWEFDYYK